MIKDLIAPIQAWLLSQKDVLVAALLFRKAPVNQFEVKLFLSLAVVVVFLFTMSPKRLTVSPCLTKFNPDEKFLLCRWWHCSGLNFNFGFYISLGLAPVSSETKTTNFVIKRRGDC